MLTFGGQTCSAVAYWWIPISHQPANLRGDCLFTFCIYNVILTKKKKKSRSPSLRHICYVWRFKKACADSSKALRTRLQKVQGQWMPTKGRRSLVRSILKSAPLQRGRLRVHFEQKAERIWYQTFALMLSSTENTRSSRKQNERN